MTKKLMMVCSVLAIAGVTTIAFSQPPGGRGERGPGQGRRGPEGRGTGERDFRPPPHPIAEALDTDRDQEISGEEMKNAPKALMALDKNKDGKLTRDELRPIRGPGGPGEGPGGGFRGPRGRGPEGGREGGPAGRGRGPEGRRPEGRGAEGRGAEGGDRARGAADFAARILGFDKNDDGKVTKDELPERMQSVIERLDKNKDGALDRGELAGSGESSEGGPRGGRGPRGEGGGDGGRRGPRGEGGEGFGGGRRGPGGPGGGPPSPERMVQHAFEFDKDDDGKLSREELKNFAEEIGRRGGPGGRGGDGEAGGRRGRPARPDSE